MWTRPEWKASSAYEPLLDNPEALALAMIALLTALGLWLTRHAADNITAAQAPMSWA